MKTIILVCSVACLALAGCAGPSSPLTPRKSGRISAAQTGVLALGAGGGAALGHAVTGDDTGTVVGGLVGLGAAAIANNKLSESAEQRELEAEERGARRARVELYEQMWNREARAPGENGGTSTKAGDEAIQYPAETYEGVKYAPRTTPSQGLSEPKR